MFSKILILILFIFTLSSVAGFVLDRPILVSYVTSNSMYPTLKVGDLFFINPLSKGGVGKIIVFKMNGHWTVHRVYADVDGGYITKGDNNVATDQQNGFSKPVNASDIAGEVITLNGNPIKIPVIGLYIEKTSKILNVSSNLYLALVLLAVGSVLLTAKDGKRNKRSKKRVVVRYKTLYTAVSAITLAVLLIAIVSFWGQIGFSYASTLAGGQRDGWYLPNSKFKRNVTLTNNGILPVVYMLKPAGSRISLSETTFTLYGKEKKEVSAVVRVPSETRIYYERIDVFSYPLIFPENALLRMAEINPYLPLTVFSAEFTLVLVLLYYVMGAGNEVVFRFRRRWV